MTSSDEWCRQADELEGIRIRIVATALALAAIGIVLVYSASAVRAAHGGWEMDYLVRQARWLGLALGLHFVISRIDYRNLRWLWVPALFVCFGALVAVLVPGIGTTVNNARRWIRFGGFNMQPSEVAKFGMILVVAALLARQPAGPLRFFRGFLPVAMLVGATAALIAVEPDFGTAALIGCVLSAILIAGGARIWHVALLGLAAAPPLVYYGITKFDHIVKRWDAFVSGSREGAGYHIWMSKLAVASGGMTGEGVGQGTAKLYYLPEAHTDFIYAIAAQELGLVGAGLILGLFLFLVVEGMGMMKRVPDRFGALLVFGIVLMIGLQAAFNIAVVTASVPPKGISLPFVSFGGSGLCMTFAAVGVLSSIGRVSAREALARAEAEAPEIPEIDAIAPMREAA